MATHHRRGCRSAKTSHDGSCLRLLITICCCPTMSSTARQNLRLPSWTKTKRLLSSLPERLNRRAKDKTGTYSPRSLRRAASAPSGFRSFGSGQINSRIADKGMTKRSSPRRMIMPSRMASVNGIKMRKVVPFPREDQWFLAVVVFSHHIRNTPAGNLGHLFSSGSPAEKRLEDFFILGPSLIDEPLSGRLLTKSGSIRDIIRLSRTMLPSFDRGGGRWCLLDPACQLSLRGFSVAIDGILQARVMGLALLLSYQPMPLSSGAPLPVRGEFHTMQGSD